MKKEKELIQERLELLFECPIIEDKRLNYTKEDEELVINILNEINKKLLELTLIDALALLNKGDL